MIYTLPFPLPPNEAPPTARSLPPIQSSFLCFRKLKAVREFREFNFRLARFNVPSHPFRFPRHLELVSSPPSAYILISMDKKLQKMEKKLAAANGLQVNAPAPAPPRLTPAFSFSGRRRSREEDTCGQTITARRQSDCEKEHGAQPRSPCCVSMHLPRAARQSPQ